MENKDYITRKKFFFLNTENRTYYKAQWFFIAYELVDVFFVISDQFKTMGFLFVDISHLDIFAKNHFLRRYLYWLYQTLGHSVLLKY